MLTPILIYLFPILAQTKCKLLLWSSNKLHLPALKHYTTDSFREVLRELGNPNIAIFETDFSQVPSSSLRYDLQLQSTYLPNAEVNFTEFRVIDHNNDVNIIKEMYSVYDDPLIVFEEKPKRNKRRIFSNYAGILYEDKGTMLYTQRHPTLRKESVTYVLNECISVTVNIIARTVQMDLLYKIGTNMTVEIEFKIILLNTNEWMLSTTMLSDSSGEIYLAPSQKIRMPQSMSYHCSSDIRFGDYVNDIVLVFYGMQLQPSSKSERFAKAVECKYYTTPGIMSVQFVVVIYMIGLYVGIGGLANIQTMDRFDTPQINLLHFDEG